MTGLESGNKKVSGVEKPKCRHLYVSRFTNNSTLGDLLERCETNGGRPILSREIKVIMAKIDNPEFWPRNVNTGNYCINVEATSLNRTSNISET